MPEASPLQLSHFQAELQDHLNHMAAAYVLTGLREGFHVGFQPLSVASRPALSNMHSALDHLSVIDDYFATEVSCGRVAGPFTTLPFLDLHISHFGVIAKSNQPGKWH